LRVLSQPRHPASRRYCVHRPESGHLRKGTGVNLYDGVCILARHGITPVPRTLSMSSCSSADPANACPPSLLEQSRLPRTWAACGASRGSWRSFDSTFATGHRIRSGGIDTGFLENMKLVRPPIPCGKQPRLPNSQRIRAHADCHAQDGGDLKYFNFSNRAAFSPTHASIASIYPSCRANRSASIHPRSLLRTSPRAKTARSTLRAANPYRKRKNARNQNNLSEKRSFEGDPRMSRRVNTLPQPQITAILLITAGAVEK